MKQYTIYLIRCSFCLFIPVSMSDVVKNAGGTVKACDPLFCVSWLRWLSNQNCTPSSRGQYAWHKLQAQVTAILACSAVRSDTGSWRRPCYDKPVRHTRVIPLSGTWWPVHQSVHHATPKRQPTLLEISVLTPDFTLHNLGLTREFLTPTQQFTIAITLCNDRKL